MNYIVKWTAVVEAESKEEAVELARELVSIPTFEAWSVTDENEIIEAAK